MFLFIWLRSCCITVFALCLLIFYLISILLFSTTLVSALTYIHRQAVQTYSLTHSQSIQQCKYIDCCVYQVKRVSCINTHNKIKYHGPSTLYIFLSAKGYKSVYFRKDIGLNCSHCYIIYIMRKITSDFIWLLWQQFLCRFLLAYPTCYDSYL